MSYLLPHRRETHDRICQRKELLAWEVDFFSLSLVNIHGRNSKVLSLVLSLIVEGREKRR